MGYWRFIKLVSRCSYDASTHQLSLFLSYNVVIVDEFATIIIVETFSYWPINIIAFSLLDLRLALWYRRNKDFKT